jgi:ABC-type polar amino acid transport system ATPase subunit
VGFARKIANRVIFNGQCMIIEENDPERFLKALKNAQIKNLLKQVFMH